MYENRIVKIVPRVYIIVKLKWKCISKLLTTLNEFDEIGSRKVVHSRTVFCLCKFICARAHRRILEDFVSKMLRKPSQFSCIVNNIT